MSARNHKEARCGSQHWRVPQPVPGSFSYRQSGRVAGRSLWHREKPSLAKRTMAAFTLRMRSN